jgi:hypothetical protein
VIVLGHRGAGPAAIFPLDVIDGRPHAYFLPVFRLKASIGSEKARVNVTVGFDRELCP